MGVLILAVKDTYQKIRKVGFKHSSWSRTLIWLPEYFGKVVNWIFKMLIVCLYCA